MGKSQGLIGNFNGKVGNMVGFKVSQSNNGTNQGVRIYQPVRKNPKTASQAEQRAKYAPIFATYRALKSIIDRGQESRPYGNASRIAWLKKAFMAEGMPWFVKGASINCPVICQLTKGSLYGVAYATTLDMLLITASAVTHETAVKTVGDISTALLASYSSLNAGDQVTIVSMERGVRGMNTQVLSFVIDTTSSEPISGFSAGAGQLEFEGNNSPEFAAIIISREGANGEHMRSTAFLETSNSVLAAAPYDDASKTDAIKSYMDSGATNDNWAEEPI